MEVSDIQSAPYGGVATITPGADLAPARGLGFVCTTAGNVTLTLKDGSTITVALALGGGSFQTLPFAVIKLTLGSGTAGTFWALK